MGGPWKDLIIDELYANARKIKLGKAMLILPGDQFMKFDYTTQMGGCTALYYSLIFQLPKWGYITKKADEWMDVSPLHAEMYNVTVAQKQRLEQIIKQGLASAAQAVADYELAKHDFRKYKEIIDYFKKGKKDEHVLRSLFIDRVDSFTGEGYSMITMAKRWPTIITDFIRMSEIPKNHRDDVDKIKDDLKVTAAEATVLKTKNQLFEKWKELFFPEVIERYARIKNLVKAREKSIEQYRDWLKPYVARFKMMNETLEKTPELDFGNALMAPSFGTSTGASGVRFFSWIPFTPPEVAKAERETKIDPWDEFVEGWAKKIEKKYNVKIIGNQKFIDKAKSYMRKDVGDTAPEGPDYINYMYYNVWDMKATRFIVKVPAKGELENLVLDIWHRVCSQNIILIHALEIVAQEEQFNRYVKELIGDKSEEDKIREEIKKEYDIYGEEEETSALDIIKKLKHIAKPFKAVKRGLLWFGNLFVRPGPYESMVYERITKMYALPSGQYYSRMVKWLKWKMNAIGAKPNW